MAKTKSKSSGKPGSLRPMACRECGETVEHVGADTISVLCSKCVQKMINKPANK